MLSQFGDVHPSVSPQVQTPIRETPREQAEATQAKPDCDPQAVLDVLDDRRSREIIECTETPKTVAELSDECDLPISTAYRKVNRLQDAGLLRQTIRFSAAGKHPEQYERAITDISISLGDETEMECQCS